MDTNTLTGTSAKSGGPLNKFAKTKNGANRYRNLVAASMAIIGVLLAVAVPARASGLYTFTTITPPGTPAGALVFATSINDNGQVLVSSELQNVAYDFTVVNDVYNINTQAFTALPAFPGAAANSTEALAINDSGVIVGDYHPAAGGYFQGFTYSGGTFANMNAFGSNDTYPDAIGNNGQVVGLVVDANEISQGYVYSNGQYHIVDGNPYPANSSFAVAINDAGEILLNSVTAGSNTACDSFLNVSGVNTSISMPGESSTCVSGINDEGVIVGYASNDGYNTYTNFIDANGVFTAFSVPGSTSSYLEGINNLGQVVGDYTDANGDTQAFVASPSPEPSTWAMLLSGLAALGAGGLQRKNATNQLWK